MKNIEPIFNNVKMKSPLIHFITNYVTVNDCANSCLACNASPIMADEEAEVEDIVEGCSSLLLNIGTLNQRTDELLYQVKKAGRNDFRIIEE